MNQKSLRSLTNTYVVCEGSTEPFLVVSHICLSTSTGTTGSKFSVVWQNSTVRYSDSAKSTAEIIIVDDWDVLLSKK